MRFRIAGLLALGLLVALAGEARGAASPQPVVTGSADDWGGSSRARLVHPPASPRPAATRPAVPARDDICARCAHGPASTAPWHGTCKYCGAQNVPSVVCQDCARQRGLCFFCGGPLGQPAASPRPAATASGPSEITRAVDSQLLLCPQCSRLPPLLSSGIGKCQVCGKETELSYFKLCYSCAKKAGKCQRCLMPLGAVRRPPASPPPVATRPAVSTAAAALLAKRVRFNGQITKKPLAKVLGQLEKKVGLKYLAPADVLAAAKPVTLETTNEKTVQEILDDACAQAGVEYSVTAEGVVAIRAQGAAEPAATPAPTPSVFESFDGSVQDPHADDRDAAACVVYAKWDGGARPPPPEVFRIVRRDAQGERLAQEAMGKYVRISGVVTRDEAGRFWMTVQSFVVGPDEPGAATATPAATPVAAANPTPAPGIVEAKLDNTLRTLLARCRAGQPYDDLRKTHVIEARGRDGADGDWVSVIINLDRAAPPYDAIAQAAVRVGGQETHRFTSIGGMCVFIPLPALERFLAEITPLAAVKANGVGLSGKGSASGGGGEANSPAAPNLDTQIEGRTFRAEEKNEIGLGPRGPALGYWSISFRDGKFSWYHSDVVESGSYRCVGAKIIGETPDKSYTGEYRPEQRVLIWQGMRYLRVDEK